jgi:hypothetical protein
MKSVINHSPEEKAMELFNQYANALYNKGLTILEYEICKQCALIAVDEILKLDVETTYLFKEKNKYTIFTHISFWKEVKLQIEIL